jgi:hypothetical protein
MYKFQNKKGFFLLLTLQCLLLTGQNNYEVANMPCNTPSKELAPAFYKNTLVFCSDRRNDFILTYTDKNNNPLTNLYQLAKKKSGKFENPKLMSRTLNTPLFEGPSTFNSDGNTIYYTRTLDASTIMGNRERSDTAFGIFMADFRNGEWTNLRPFSFNSSSYNTGYPYITNDGRQLFFCSDAPGGFGGLDVYVSTLNNGQWSEPENLGPTINTAKNEVFPFVQRNGRLYFASRGYNEKGDMDIYYTTKVDGAWQTPSRMPEPFNTVNDDYGLIFNAASDTGYFVSDRAGSADIFAVYSTLPTFSNCTYQQENDYCFVFYESNNSDIDTSTYAYEWNLGDGTKMRSIEAEHCFAAPGTYQVELNIIDKLTADVLISQATYSFVVDNIEQPFIQCADTVMVGENTRMDAKASYYKTFTIDSYYWDFDDGSSATGIETRHTYSAPGTYKIRLGVTDVHKDLPEAGLKSCVTRDIVVLEVKH